MIKIEVKDFRKSVPSGSSVEIEYDPATIQEFDTRGKCPSRYMETWGQKVELEVGGKPCVLYLELNNRSVGHVLQNKNILKDS